LTIAAALGATDELGVCDLAWVTERAENLASHPARTLRTLGFGSQPPGRQDGPLVGDDQPKRHHPRENYGWSSSLVDGAGCGDQFGVVRDTGD